MTLNFPDNPTLNQTYSYGGVIWRYDGEKWRVTGTASQPTIQVSSGAPTGAREGDAWVDSDEGALYVYYDNFWIAPTVNLALPTSAVNTAQIADGAVTTEKLALGPTYTSALPSSPIEGQEIYYAANAASSVIWHLRYRFAARSGSGAWEYLGGQPLRAAAGYSDTTADHSVFRAYGGPSIALPRPGLFNATYNSQGTGPGSGNFIKSHLKLGTAAINEVDDTMLFQTQTGSGGAITGGLTAQFSTSSALTVEVQHRCFSNLAGYVSARRLLISPVYIY
jgi:hypothetical protein